MFWLSLLGPFWRRRLATFGSFWHGIVSHPVFIRSLAAWALVLVARWRVILRAKERERSAVTVVAPICTGGGVALGLFWGFLWAVVVGY